jgi:hypothetical protein
MAANLFDVFVVGSSDPSTAGETRLAAALSTKHGVPLPTVAKAIAAKNLRAGQGLEQSQAQALVKQLQAMGAVTVIRPAAGRATTVQSARSTGTMPVAKMSGVQPVASPTPAPVQVRSPMPSSTGWAAAPLPAPTPAPISLSGASSFGMPAVGTGSADPFAPLAASSAPAAPTDGRDPFQPRKVVTPVISTAKVRTPAPPQYQAMPSGSGLALDVAQAPAKLELARGSRRPPDEEEEVAPRARTAMSASSLREMDAGGASGVAMDEDPKNLNLVRCVQHGLYYDKTKASGCRKCLAGARDFVSKMEQQGVRFRIADFRGKPAKRAFLGLAFALLLGFLPAAYYCFGPGGTEAHHLRLEQEVLSRQTGTEDTLRVFDDLDVQVKVAHERSSRNTAVVWLAVTGVAMLGWYKVT